MWCEELRRGRELSDWEEYRELFASYFREPPRPLDIRSSAEP